ncbi:hypothetical protein JK156_22150 [Enterobacter ludwigii]|nr:hypothetical protein [Enterobacter ludwigii]
MSELRAGRMALVYGLKNQSELNGRCVQLLFMVSHGDIYKSPVSEKKWRHGADSPAWISTGDVYTSKKEEFGYGVFRPCNLMPIDGEDFSHEDERQKELTNG